MLVAYEVLEIQRGVKYLLRRYKRQNLSLPNKLIGINLMVKKESIVLDHAHCAERIVIEGRGLNFKHATRLRDGPS